MQLEVLFGPADFASLPGQDLRETACVVFDVLRATTTAVTALANGARAIRPVSTIEEALAERRHDADVLLAGERGGLRIGAGQTGGAAFDLGNSPREFTPAVVAGRTLVMTTTNGTRALRASAGAGRVLAAAFVNLGAVVRNVRDAGLPRVLLVCAGTGESTALEDVLAAGAFAQRLAAEVPAIELADTARIAEGAWAAAQPDFAAVARESRNARRLLAFPDLAEDVAICLTADVCPAVPRLVEGRELRLEG